MNFENKFSRFMRNSGPARVLVPIGLMLIVFGIVLFLFKTENYVETMGKITEVTDVTVDKGQKEYDVSIQYTVDGKEYNSVFPNLSGEYNVGDDIQVFYDPEDPERITNSKTSSFIAPLMVASGAVAIFLGIRQTARAFKKSKELDQTAPGKGAPRVDFGAFMTAPGVTEYYCRHDGETLRPGYVLEDAYRGLIFEAKMLKNALVGTRTFRFTDHTTGSVKEHEVGHTMTQTYNEEFLSARSWFKFDGKNIWDVVHERGLRLSTDIRSEFPRVVYEASKDGQPFARIEACSKYVHEDEEAQHKILIPVGRYYYRVWTNTKDFETLFLAIFAVSETEQVMTE